MKTHTTRIPFVAIAGTFLFAVAPSVRGQEDRIFSTKGGSQIRGKIMERTKDKIVIDVRGTNQNFAINEVARVIFDGEPQQLIRTKEAISQGNLDSAMDEFNKVDAGSLKSDEIKQDYQFYKGFLAASNALRGKGDLPAAKDLLFNWVRANQNSHHFYSAAELLGELAMAAGTPGDAAKYFGALANSNFPDFKVKGGYLAGKAALAQKQVADAKTKLAAVAQAQVSDPASIKFKKLASVALIACEAAEGKADSAIESLEKMVDEGDSSDAELFAELYNAMGGILQTQGKNEEAILAFLKTKLLYSTELEAHSESLYWLSQLWPKVGDNQRATEAKTELAKTYPTSHWLKK